MKRLSKLLSAVAITAALATGSLVAAAPANAASGCSDAEIYTLGHSFPGDNSILYSTTPCNLTYNDKYGNQLVNNYMATVAAVRSSEGWYRNSPTYNKYQSQAKQILIKDVLNLGMQAAAINSKKFNTQSVSDYREAVSEIANQQLTRSRVNSVYHVLFFHYAYIKKQMGLVNGVYDFWDSYTTLTGLWNSWTKSGKIKSVADGILEIPSFDSIYTTFVDKFKMVIMRFVQGTLDITFHERLAWAL